MRGAGDWGQRGKGGGTYRARQLCVCNVLVLTLQPHNAWYKPPQYNQVHTLPCPDLTHPHTHTWHTPFLTKPYTAQCCAACQVGGGQA